MCIVGWHLLLMAKETQPYLLKRKGQRNPVKVCQKLMKMMTAPYHTIDPHHNTTID